MLIPPASKLVLPCSMEGLTRRQPTRVSPPSEWRPSIALRGRFAYQNFPDRALPPELQNANPRGIWRMIDGQLTRDAVSQ